jgi:hypothetical protein
VLGLTVAGSKAPARKSMRNIASTTAGEPTRMASVRRFRPTIAAVRAARTTH